MYDDDPGVQRSYDETLPLFRREVIEGKRHKLVGDVVLEPPLATMGATVILVALGVIAIGAATSVKFDRIAIGRGALTSQASAVDLRVPQPAILLSLKANRGADVEKNQLIGVFRAAAPTLGGKSMNAAILDLNQGALSLESAEHDATLQERDATTSYLSVKEAGLLAEIERGKAELGLAEERSRIAERGVEKYRDLVNQGYGSQVELNRRTEAALESRQSILTTQSKIGSLQADLAEARMARRKASLEYQRAIIAATRRREAIAKDNIALNSAEQMGVRAPIPGTLSDISVSEGAYLDPSVAFAVVVPKGEVLADVLIPSDKGYAVTQGNRSRVYVDGYPVGYQAPLWGTVALVSPHMAQYGDTKSGQASTYLKVQIRLDHGQKPPLTLKNLKQGTPVRAEIVFGRKTLLQRLFER